VHGILVPGGFGERGAEGKIAAVTFARSTRCRISASASACRWRCVEAARNLAGIADATSTEFGEAKEPVVGLMTEWMRGNELETRARTAIWAAPCGWAPMTAKLAEGSRIAAVYGATRFPSATGTATRSTSLSRAAGKGGA
jgi:CTP synthase